MIVLLSWPALSCACAGTFYCPAGGSGSCWSSGSSAHEIQFCTAHEQAVLQLARPCAPCFSVDLSCRWLGKQLLKYWECCAPPTVSKGYRLLSAETSLRLCCCLLCPTGGWDKCLKYWDCRSPTPALQVTLPERVYAMDVNHPLLVVGCADRHIWVYNLAQPDKPYKQIQSPLKWQTRCVACFPGELVCADASRHGDRDHSLTALAGGQWWPSRTCRRGLLAVAGVQSASHSLPHALYPLLVSDVVLRRQERLLDWVDRGARGGAPCGGGKRQQELHIQVSQVGHEAGCVQQQAGLRWCKLVSQHALAEAARAC